MMGYGHDSIVVLANDKNYQSQCGPNNEKGDGGFIKLKPPVIVIFDYNDNPISRIMFFYVALQEKIRIHI